MSDKVENPFETTLNNYVSAFEGFIIHNFTPMIFLQGMNSQGTVLLLG